MTGSDELVTKERKKKVTQSCPTLCNPMDSSLPGSSVHGIFQARILEWVANSFSRRPSWPRDWTQFSHIVGRCFNLWATRVSYQPSAKYSACNVHIHLQILTSNILIHQRGIYAGRTSVWYIQQVHNYILPIFLILYYSSLPFFF